MPPTSARNWSTLKAGGVCFWCWLKALLSPKNRKKKNVFLNPLSNLWKWALTLVNKSQNRPLKITSITPEYPTSNYFHPHRLTHVLSMKWLSFCVRKNPELKLSFSQTNEFVVELNRPNCPIKCRCPFDYKSLPQVRCSLIARTGFDFILWCSGEVYLYLIGFDQCNM